MPEAGWRMHVLGEVVGPLTLVDFILALDTAQSITYDDRREWALSEVVGPLARVAPALALDTARTVMNVRWRTRALTYIARAVGSAAVASEALDTARSSSDNGPRAQILAEVVAPLASLDPALALRIARDIADNTWRARILAGLARVLGDIEIADEAFDIA
jgi:hypothetical protein